MEFLTDSKLFTRCSFFRNTLFLNFYNFFFLLFFFNSLFFNEITFSYFSFNKRTYFQKIQVKKFLSFPSPKISKRFLRSNKFIFRKNFKNKNITFIKNFKKYSPTLLSNTPNSSIFKTALLEFKSSLFLFSFFRKNSFPLTGDIFTRLSKRFINRLAHRLILKKNKNDTVSLKKNSPRYSRKNNIDVFRKKIFINNFFYLKKNKISAKTDFVNFNFSFKKLKLKFNRYLDSRPTLIFGGKKLNLSAFKSILGILISYRKALFSVHRYLKKKKKLKRKINFNPIFLVFNNLFRTKVRKPSLFIRKFSPLFTDSLTYFSADFRPKNFIFTPNPSFFSKKIKKVLHKNYLISYSSMLAFKTNRRRLTFANNFKKTIKRINNLKTLIFIKKNNFLIPKFSLRNKKIYFCKRVKFYRRRSKSLKKKHILLKTFFLKTLKSFNFEKNLFSLTLARVPVKNFSTLPSRAHSLFLRPSPRNKLFSSKLIKSFYKKPIFTSRVDFAFSHSYRGFLYLSDKSDFFEFKASNSFMLRKLIYSFSFKNELQNYILKKYVKSNYNSVNLRPILHKYEQNPFYFDQSFLEYLNPKLLESSAVSLNQRFPRFSLVSFGSPSLMGRQPRSVDWNSRLPDLTYLESLNETAFTFSIKKIKFKPGYSSMWREAREVFKTSLNLKFRYQKKLTNYLLKFNKIIKNKIYFIFEMQLVNIVINTKILPDRPWTDLFLNNALIHVNGYVCFNPFTQLFKSDFVQLIVNLKYYIFYRWLLNWHLLKRIRLKNKISKKINNKKFADDKQRSNIMPLWILTNKNFNEDVSKFLEIDYFTLSAVILYEPILVNEINPYNFIHLRFNVINLFNWKYIN